MSTEDDEVDEPEQIRMVHTKTRFDLTSDSGYRFTINCEHVFNRSDESEGWTASVTLQGGKGFLNEVAAIKHLALSVKALDRMLRASGFEES